MYNFIYNMYRMGRIDEATVIAFVAKGCITGEQSQNIIDGL